MRMDPLTLLPVEVWRLIFNMLPLDDRVTSGQVSRSWRQFFRDPTLWIHVTLEVGEDPRGLSLADDADSYDDSSEWEDVDDEDSTDSDSADEQSEGMDDQSEGMDDQSEGDNSTDDHGEADKSVDDLSVANSSVDDRSEANKSVDDQKEALNTEEDHREYDDIEGTHGDGSERNIESASDGKYGASANPEDTCGGSNMRNSEAPCNALKFKRCDDVLDIEGSGEGRGGQEDIRPHSANGDDSSSGDANGPCDESAFSGQSNPAGAGKADGGQQSAVTVAEAGLPGDEAAEKPLCLLVREPDRTACRVLRAAPFLRLVVVRGWHVRAPIMEALMDSAAQVTGLCFTTFIAQPEDAEKIVSKFRLHLEELHLREASGVFLKLLSCITVPRLRTLAVDSVAECPLGSHLNSGMYWIEDPLPSLTPDPLVKLIRAHSSTLRNFTIGNMWSWVTHTNQVMKAVASCRGLTRLGVLCSEFLRIGAVSNLPALTHLSLKMMLHDDEQVDHRVCLEPLPPSLKSLELTLLMVHFETEVLDLLVRQAPGLPNLRSLHLRFMFEAPGTKKHLQCVRAAFPGVTVTSEFRIDLKTMKDNQHINVCSTFPAVRLPSIVV